MAGGEKCSGVRGWWRRLCEGKASAHARKRGANWRAAERRRGGAEDDEDVHIGVARGEFALGESAVEDDGEELVAEGGGELGAETGETVADGIRQRRVSFPVGGHGRTVARGGWGGEGFST